MIINHSDTSGGGTQPVRVLQHSLIDIFEKARPDFLDEVRDIVLKQGLRTGIHYQEGENSILVFGPDGRPTDCLTACANKRHEVVLHETFLSYLWCISYALITLFEEANLRPARGLPPSDPGHDHVGRARSLFDYGLGLIHTFTTWDLKLPNPQQYSNSERLFIEKANGVFCEAVTFVLLHEVAHVALGHTSQLGRQISDQQSCAHERAADQWAIMKGFVGTDGATNKFTKQAGAVAGLCAMMLLSRTLLGQDHPDIDERLTAGVALMDLEENSAIWLIALLGVRLWQQSYGQDVHWPDKAGSPKEYFTEVMAELRRRKISGWVGR